METVRGGRPRTVFPRPYAGAENKKFFHRQKNGGSPYQIRLNYATIIPVYYKNMGEGAAGMRRGALRLTALTLALACGLSGCFFRAADDLYSVPDLPEEYLNLQTKLSEAVSAGGEYAAPLGGEYIQSVQLQDLDGDGVREALAFFRFTNDEKPMKIYIYRQVKGSYQEMAVIEGAASAISSVDYVQMNADPAKEIVVSWQMGEKVHSVSAYAVSPGSVSELVKANYDSYKLCDIDQDGEQELVVLRTQTAGAAPVAELYNAKNGEIALEDTVSLSAGVTSVAAGGMRMGQLRGGGSALFVFSRYGEKGSVTDILLWRDGDLQNISMDAATGDSTETIRYYTQVTGSDINGDSIMELPQPEPLPDYKPSSAATNFWLINWRQYDEQGTAWPVFTTYHNDQDGWYFVVPETWVGQLTLSRSDLPGGGERAVTFSLWNGDDGQIPSPFLVIYKLTGDNRATRATIGKRFLLSPSQTGSGALPETLYAAEFVGTWDCGLTQDQVRENFALIKTDWAAN